jgi:succinoglycan biosynthesis transport protein ExoP
MFSEKLTDLTLREKARHATARIIEYAVPPDGPIRPKKFESILFTAAIGLFVGICLALLQEFLDDRINTSVEGEATLGLPSLGSVPSLTATDAHLLPQMQRMDPASESYRILRTNIHFAAIDMPQRTLLITSSAPAEGKTTTAANIAFAMAADGKNVILVDTDLRRPALHTLLSLPARPGLTDVLVGDCELTDAIWNHEEMAGLRVLPCGSLPPNPSEMLGSRAFRTLVERLTEEADLVIFDSPPVMAAADAQILASQMDGTILVVEAGQTRKAAARRSLELLRQGRANLLGAAYNKMRDPEGSGYYAYYTPKQLAQAHVHEPKPPKRLNGDE